MKKTLTLCTTLFFVTAVFAQGLWQSRAVSPDALDGSVTFSINSVGYMYTGASTNNFYQYDPVADSWTAKANFPGGARDEAAGFAIGNFGYVGTGRSGSSTFHNDFYRYDPVGDSWLAKADLPDSLMGAFGFVIDTIGYIGAGVSPNSNGLPQSFYAYNAASDQWTQVADIPLAMAFGFANVVNGKAYVGLGLTTTSRVDSVYEYNPVGDTWQAKAPYNIPANQSIGSNMYSFVVGNKIYVSDATINGAFHGVMAIFDPSLNSWSQINTIPFPSGSPCEPLVSMAGLTIGGRGFFSARNNCTLTTFWEFNPNESFAITSVSPDTVCEGDLIQVTFSSSLTFNSGNHFKLKFNGTPFFWNHGFSDSLPGTTTGTYTFRVPQFLNNTTANAKLELHATNARNQSSYSNINVFVKKGAREMVMANEYEWCGATSALLLYRQGAGYTSYWSSNPAGVVSDTAAMISFTPTQTTTIYVTDVYNATGCSVTDSTIVNFSQLPQLQIADSLFEICPGSSVTIGGTPVTNASYTWTGGGVNSAVVNPTVSPVANTTSHVVVTDTTNGCAAAGNTRVNLSQPPLQDICFVTVDTASTHNVIIWEKVDREATDSFIIYREISTNNYQRIGAVHHDSLSEFHDYGANPNVTAYRYKISANDTCNNESTLSAYHNTIHLQYLGSGNLIWNVYEIENATTPVLSFDVYWDTLANGNWSVMANVPGNQHTATDINFSQHPGALYRIVANWAYTCTPTRGASEVLSNIININVGVNDLDLAKEISLFPNPAESVLQVNSSKNSIEQVRILGPDGSVAAIAQQPVNAIDVSKLAAGVYIAEIKIGKATVMKRWVKM